MMNELYFLLFMTYFESLIIYLRNNSSDETNKKTQISRDLALCKIRKSLVSKSNCQLEYNLDEQKLSYQHSVSQ